MLRLVTPGTGLPDLEAKLAFGLVRLAAETRQPFDLKPEPGRYRLTLSASSGQLNDAFRLQARRHYASETPFRLPGIQAQYRPNYPTVDSQAELKPAYRDADLVVLFRQGHQGERNPWSRNQCGHNAIEPFGGKSGLILATSSHAGMPPRRDRLSGGNLRLCAVCGLLVVIGIRSACLRNLLGSGSQRLTVLTSLIPQTALRHDTLLEILAVQKEFDQRPVCGLIPLQTAPLAVLTRFPHLAQLLATVAMRFHLTLYSHGRTDRVDATQVVDATRLARFLHTSPFHSATVEALLGSGRTPPVVSALVELTRALTTDALSDRRHAAIRFARITAMQELGGQPRLLYHSTGRHLAEEICMIPPSIIEHEAIGAVADLVRYFVVHRNYGYVDAIRNARDGSRDLERTLTAMLRECWTRRDPDTGRDDCPRAHFVPLPDEGQIRTIMTLAQTAFEDVKLALALLGLSRREWEPTVPAVSVEVDSETDSLEEGDPDG